MLASKPLTWKNSLNCSSQGKYEFCQLQVISKTLARASNCRPDQRLSTGSTERKKDWLRLLKKYGFFKERKRVLLGRCPFDDALCSVGTSWLHEWRRANSFLEGCLLIPISHCMGAWTRLDHYLLLPWIWRLRLWHQRTPPTHPLNSYFTAKIVFNS